MLFLFSFTACANNPSVVMVLSACVYISRGKYLSYIYGTAFVSLEANAYHLK